MNHHHSRMELVQLPIIPIVAKLIKQHPGTISLGQGVVSYSPPPQTLEYLTKFWSNPENHKYQGVQGIPPLLSAITRKLQQENGIEINNQDNCIVVTAGSNMAFMNAILAITNAGDEIILQTPYYFNHEMAVRMANCQPIFVPTDANYQICLENILKAITAKTKAIVTISPNNPTGVVYSASAFKAINQICQEKEIYHISDEAYEYFTYDNTQHFSPATILNSTQYTISLFSLSKAYGFASWRIGYMVIPQSLLTAVKKVQDTILICPPVISQYAALGALEAGYKYCQQQLHSIIKVRDIVLKSLQSTQGLYTIADSLGAFYFFLKINTEMNDLDLVTKLVKEYGIAAIPGSTFGMRDGCYLRIAYGALIPETASTGINRLITGLKAILV